MAPSENGDKIKLSWHQVAWGISMIALIILTYADLKSRVDTLSTQISQIYTKTEIDKTVFILQQEDGHLHKSINVINKKLGIETGE